jgi:hypothetical protein
MWFELMRVVHKCRQSISRIWERFCMEELSKILSNVFSKLRKHFIKRLSAVILARGGCWSIETRAGWYSVFYNIPVLMHRPVCVLLYLS